MEDGDSPKGLNRRLEMVMVVEDGDSLKGLNRRLKMAMVVEVGDSLKGLNGRLKMAMVVVVGMHKDKAVRNCVGKDKQEYGMDQDLVVVGMHRDCGVDMKMMNHNYPSTKTKFCFFTMPIDE